MTDRPTILRNHVFALTHEMRQMIGVPGDRRAALDALTLRLRVTIGELRDHYPRDYTRLIAHLSPANGFRRFLDSL